MDEPIKHEHAYKPSASKNVRLEDGIYTAVLLHCNCGSLDYARIPGEWTWEEISKQPVMQPTPKTDEVLMSEMGIAVEKL